MSLDLSILPAHTEILETPRLKLIVVTPELRDHIYTDLPASVGDIFGLYGEEAIAMDKEKFEQGLVNYNISHTQFPIYHKDSQQVIGRCGYHTWYFRHNRAEIGYHIALEEYKNQGFTKEALAAMLRYGFEQMGLNRIEALLSPQNIPSVKLVEHFGFMKEGLLRGHYLRNGVYEDSAMYALLKTEING